MYIGAHPLSLRDNNPIPCLHSLGTLPLALSTLDTMAHLSGSNDLVTEKAKRMRVPSRKVRDVANDAELELFSHREAQTEAQHAHAAVATVQPKASAASSSTGTSSFASSAPSCKRSRTSSSIADVHGDDGNNTDGEEIKTTNAESSCGSTGGNDPPFPHEHDC